MPDVESNRIEYKREIDNSDKLEKAVDDAHRNNVSVRLHACGDGSLRAAMDAYESCCKPKPFKRVYREVKDLAGILGAVRDTDVMIRHLQQWAGDMPEAERDGVDWLMERLQTYRQEQLCVMDEEVQSLEGKNLRQKIAASMRK